MKKALFTGIPNVKLIVPSQWLKSRVQAGFMGEYPVEVRYNQVDQSIFKPTPGNFREKYHLEHQKILLGVASVWDRRKGLEDFIALGEMLQEPYKIVLVGLTEKQIQALPETILGLPRTGSAGALAEIYSAADLYLNPSVEETFGMTVLEAGCCGTHPVVYEGTACEEVARRFGGTVVKRGPQNLLQAVKDYFGEDSQ